MKEEKNSSQATRETGQGAENRKGISRRGFLKGAGLTTAGTVMLQTGLLGKESEQLKTADGPIGPDAVLINMKVNGRQKTVKVEPRTTLAQALRDHLELTGTKVVCDRGACSACTVWLDGKPVNSCITLAMDAAGREVTTIEGISQDGKLHPVQQAFIDHDASQCGYCTPGMIMASVHLLQEHPSPDLDQVKKGLRGNLCRCGTHPHIFNAVLDASKKL